MELDQAIAERVRKLPPSQKREVLRFVDGLGSRQTPETGASLLGIWADLDIVPTADEISEARREMWGQFPREVV